MDFRMTRLRHLIYKAWLMPLVLQGLSAAIGACCQDRYIGITASCGSVAVIANSIAMCIRMIIDSIVHIQPPMGCLQR